jgi:rhodanese-related sulfurtransferase
MLLALYLSAKYFQRWRFLRNLRISRVTPHELRSLLESGERITIIDLRHPAEIEREGMKIAGAKVVDRDDLRSLSHEIPENQEIVLYCT